MKIFTAGNSAFLKDGISYSKDSFVVYQTLVFFNHVLWQKSRPSESYKSLAAILKIQ